MTLASQCVYLGCPVDANCVIWIDVLRADELTVSL